MDTLLRANGLRGGVPELQRPREGPSSSRESSLPPPGGEDDERRSLEGGQQRQGGGSYLVDDSGTQYDPNQLFWRYLGLFVDCDGVGSGGYCARKLLWAAYLDRKYEGNGIEEYQFYDLATDTWDDSTCYASGRNARCAPMDCHVPNTDMELVGVFKETDGMYDWTEQLFKHEGMCIWNDDDAYETMETWMGKWPTYCTQLGVTDGKGRTIYMAIEPAAEGNMTVAIYADSGCTKVSTKIDLRAYFVKYYQSKGLGEDAGYQAFLNYEEAIATWNEKMSYFKVCQPCIAYNRQQDYRRRRRKDRLLEREDRLLEGGGNCEYERDKYNCYDDAGYTNVNQCYKFESKTSLSAASTDDLLAASNQGSIVRITSNEQVVYGKGGYGTHTSRAKWNMASTLVILSIVALACVYFALVLHSKIISRRRRRMKVALNKRHKRKSQERRSRSRSRKIDINQIEANNAVDLKRSETSRAVVTGKKWKIGGTSNKADMKKEMAMSVRGDPRGRSASAGKSSNTTRTPLRQSSSKGYVPPRNVSPLRRVGSGLQDKSKSPSRGTSVEY